MPSIDFSKLRQKYPQYAIAWEWLSGWMSRHPQEKIIDPRLVKKFTRDISPDTIGKALIVLVQDGDAKIVYRVVDPGTGTLLDGDFDTIAEIPQHMHDRQSHLFDTENAMIVPVLQKVD